MLEKLVPHVTALKGQIASQLLAQAKADDLESTNAELNLDFLRSREEACRRFLAFATPEKVTSGRIIGEASSLKSARASVRKNREEWKYTSLAGLPTDDSAPGDVSGSDILQTVSSEDIGNILKAWPLNAQILVFVDGLYAGDFSADTGTDLPIKNEAIEIEPLSQRKSGTVGDVTGEGVISLLNTACSRDGLSIKVGKGVQAEKTLLLLHLTRNIHQTVTAPRNVIALEQGASLKVVELFYSLPAQNIQSPKLIFSCPKTQLLVADGAVLDYTKVGNESGDVVHLGILMAELGESAQLRANVFNFGSLLTRQESTAILAGEHANFSLHGLNTISNSDSLKSTSQHVDNHVNIIHAAPNCESRQLFRGVYGSASRGVFSGTITVNRDAQKTNAYQVSSSLLLTDEAGSCTRPQLKIFADDVKCSHGATVGQIDPEALFYLRSRGLPLEDAKKILVMSFCEEIVQSLTDPSLVEALEPLLSHHLQKALLTQA